MKIDILNSFSPKFEVQWHEKELENVFQLFDSNGKGHIEESDLKSVLRNFGMHITNKELADLTEPCKFMEEKKQDIGIDTDVFSFFVEQLCSGGLNDDDLKNAFKLFDRHGNGFVTREDLRDVMCKWSREPSEEELDEMMQEVDLNGDGLIDFHEFLAAITAT